MPILISVEGIESMNQRKGRGKQMTLAPAAANGKNSLSSESSSRNKIAATTVAIYNMRMTLIRKLELKIAAQQANRTHPLPQQPRQLLSGVATETLCTYTSGH